MGCRHSRVDDPDDPKVESLRYSRRSTKITRSKRKKSSKSSSGSHDANMTGTSEPTGEESCDGSAAGETGSSTKEISVIGKNSDKNTNERIQKFGNQSLKNVLTLSVDTPETAQMEVKHGKFRNKHFFPVWESHFHERCKCVNLDLNDVSSNKEGRCKTSSSTAHLCKRCSQAILNNKRGLSNNNNGGGGGGGSGGGGGRRAEANGAVDGVGASSSDGGERGGGGKRGGVVASRKDPNVPPFHEPAKHNQIAAIANLLALAALDLSAPASSLLVKNRKNAWIQLAGHPGSFAPAGPNTIWKKRLAKENYETLAYQALCECSQSRNIMPTFYREVEFNGEYFIEIEDLLHHFNDPSIMDIKMGTRTFLESEVKNPVLRKDLFEKMIKVDPDAPTAEEKEQEAITKLRYMQFREQESSTASLGFRIEAIRMSGEPPNTSLKKVRTKEEVSYFIKNFVKGHEVVIPTLHQRLSAIREKFECIPFFSSHEIIGSSILVMFDSSNHAGAWMIDFAKTIPVTDVTLNHRSPWKLENHEDGYLCGMDNLIEIFQKLAEDEEAKPAEDTCKSDS